MGISTDMEELGWVGSMYKKRRDRHDYRDGCQVSPSRTKVPIRPMPLTCCPKDLALYWPRTNAKVVSETWTLPGAQVDSMRLATLIQSAKWVGGVKEGGEGGSEKNRKGVGLHSEDGLCRNG